MVDPTRASPGRLRAGLEASGPPEIEFAAKPAGAITPPGFYGSDAAHFYRMADMEGTVWGPGGRYNAIPDERGRYGPVRPCALHDRVPGRSVLPTEWHKQ